MDIEKQTANEIAEEADNAQGREISDDALEGVVGGACGDKPYIRLTDVVETDLKRVWPEYPWYFH